MQRMIGKHCAQIWGELPLRRHSVLLCLGSAPGFKAQAQAFLAENVADVAACNDAITAWPLPLFLAASLHAERLAAWMRGRTAMDGKPCVIGPEVASGVDVVVGFNKAVGSSGMYLALLGGLMGYSRIVLAGIRLEREGEQPYREIWRVAREHGALNRVETLSGGWIHNLLA